VASSTVVIDRPQGSRHPRDPDQIYPIDYGYLEGTVAADGGGIDVWRGSLPHCRVTGLIATIDLQKRNTEIKPLLGCTPEEARLALTVHNQGEQTGILLERALSCE
jgi:inorganic pyrophosphatase